MKAGACEHKKSSGVKKEVRVRKIKVNPKLKENKIVFSRSGISLVEITTKSAEKRARIIEHVRQEAVRVRKKRQSSKLGAIKSR